MSREPRIASASLVLARQPTLCTMCTRKKFQFAICTSRLGIGSGKCVSSEGLSSASGMYRFCCTFWSGGRKGDPVIRDNEGRFLSMRESGKGSVLFHVVSHSTKLLSLTLSLVDFWVPPRRSPWRHFAQRPAIRPQNVQTPGPF